MIKKQSLIQIVQRTLLTTNNLFLLILRKVQNSGIMLLIKFTLIRIDMNFPKLRNLPLLIFVVLYRLFLSLTTPGLIRLKNFHLFTRTSPLSVHLLYREIGVLILFIGCFIASLQKFFSVERLLILKRCPGIVLLQSRNIVFLHFVNNLKINL